MVQGKIRLGLVGVGKIARDQHVPAILGHPRFELVATASPVGEIDGIPAFPDLATLIANVPNLDAVTLCTPPAVRAALAEQALAAGLHVMLEKPPAACLSQAEAMISAAGASGRSIFAAWHSRETSCVDAAAAWLNCRRIDRVEVVWREDVRVWHPGQDWLLAAGGFGVFDSAINAFSILTRILPGPFALQSALLGVPQNRQAPMTAELVLRHGVSAPMTCDLSIIHEGAPQWDIAVCTDAGILNLTGGGHHLIIDGQPQLQDNGSEYQRLYSRFADLLDAGCSEVDTRPLTLVADAMLLGQASALPGFEF